MEPSLVCFKGVWISYNEFQTEQGELIRIVPYKGFVKSYSPVFPHPCFMHLKRNGNCYIIKDVIPIE